MSLYYDAATVLQSSGQRGSLKSLVYAKDSSLKSKPAHVYALISETAKYDIFLKEVIDNAGMLGLEPKLTPILALLIVHDHFFAKNGIAAPSAHPLRQSVERHRARLQSEFTRARLRRKAATIEQLKEQLNLENGTIARASPRWARVNLVKSSLSDVLDNYFSQYTRLNSVQDVVKSSSSQKVLHVDAHVPDLIAFPPDQDLTKTQAYTQGQIILQDKASCFPAHLLLGNTRHDEVGDVIDGCAAPGNKTTHAAAILSTSNKDSTIFACERDATRSKTLQQMVTKAGADNVIAVLARQDFLALDPDDDRFANVTHLLLDPSCSGSGILGREDIPQLKLPVDVRRNKDQPGKQNPTSKKRKRETDDKAQTTPDDIDNAIDATSEAQPLSVDKGRLEKLSNLQSLIVEHAFRFPAARRVTYSTCSIHVEENEAVVHRVLQSAIGKSRGWKVLRRDQQVEGMKAWSQRGINAKQDKSQERAHLLDDEEVEACIRCTPGDGEGTMGFFVCAFVRDVDVDAGERHESSILADDEEWDGFSDD